MKENEVRRYGSRLVTQLEFFMSVKRGESEMSTTMLKIPTRILFDVALLLTSAK